MRKPHTRVTTKICWTSIIRAFRIEVMRIFSVGKLFCTSSAGDDASYVRFGETKDKYFNRSLRHGTEMRHQNLRSDSVHTSYIGTGAILVPGCYNSVWYGNSSNQDCKALQKVMRLAECISGSTLPSLQDIYFKRCKSRAAKIIKNLNHPGNHLFRLLPSGNRFRSMMAKTERLRRSFFPQAIRLLNTNSVS